MTIPNKLKLLIAEYEALICKGASHLEAMQQIATWAHSTKVSCLHKFICQRGQKSDTKQK